MIRNKLGLVALVATVGALGTAGSSLADNSGTPPGPPSQNQNQQALICHFDNGTVAFNKNGVQGTPAAVAGDICGF